MKTTNSKTGNRSHNTLNNLLKSAAVVASVILLSFTVSAQELWKQFLTNNSFGKMAVLMMNESEASYNEVAFPSSSETSNYYFGEEAEDELEIEPWMTETEYFSNAENLFKAESENSLELEDWMTTNKYFGAKYSPEKEDELKLEAWMTDNSNWTL